MRTLVTKEIRNQRCEVLRYTLRIKMMQCDGQLLILVVAGKGRVSVWTATHVYHHYID